MNRIKPATLPHKSPARFFSTITLAFWCLRQTWFLLLITAVGLVAAIVLACLVPLLSSVMMTAGLHDVFSATPQNSTIFLNASTFDLSSRTATAVQQQLDAAVYKQLQPYLRSRTVSTLELPNLVVENPDWPAKPYSLGMYALSPQQASPYIHLLQGRLPQDTLVDGEIEVLLNPDQAADFHLSVGDTFTLQSVPHALSQEPPEVLQQFHLPTFKMHVVGIFKANSSADLIWQGTDFQPFETKGVSYYSLFAPIHAMLAATDAQHMEQQIMNRILTSGEYTLGQIYSFNISAISVAQLDPLMQHLQVLHTTLTNAYGDVQGNDNPDGNNTIQRFPSIQNVTLVSTVFSFPGTASILENYNNHLAVARIPVLLLTLQVVALLLYFVSIMTDLLIERQGNTIAVIRSRGGSGQQIFGALLTQCFFLLVLALLLAPLLALVLATGIARSILSLSEQSALQTILAQPLAALWETRWYALGVAAMALLTVVLSLMRTVQMDVLSSRREASRSRQKPFWQRFNLDGLAGVIALLGYGISLYLTSVGSLLDARSQVLVMVPLSLITPLFLVIGCLLLFLRLFPFLLRLGASLAVRGKGAASMLALAQMARSPRQSVRMTMLLALALAFTIFSLIFSASQQQRVTDLANYESGADFRGARSNLLSSLDINQAKKLYARFPGVLSVTPGWNASGYPTTQGAALRIEFRAVDSDSFASTAYWPAQVGGEPLPQLLKALVTMRMVALQKNVVPVIIDANMRDRLKLHVGSTFLADTQALRFDLNYLVVGIVTHMPTVNDNTDITNNSSSDTLPSGGMLLDYQTLSQVYQQNLVVLGLPNDLSINQIWLHTSDNSSSLLKLRQLLTDSSYALDNLYDRRQLIIGLGSDPLYVNLTSMLLLGVGAALFLAVLGDLLLSWFNARSRLTNFAVLRAIGSGPRQVASVFTWEQSIIYITAFILGSLFGGLFAFTVVPVLLFNSQPDQGALSMLNSDEMYALQHVIPTHLIVPQTLWIVFAILLLLCVLALGMMVRVVARPSLAQTLRLNED